MRVHRFPSLFSALAGAFILFAGIVPKADAQVLVYFNFEDGTLGSTVDFQSDTVGPPDNNPGGGIQGPVTLENNLTTFASVAGTLLNRTAGDSDTADPGLAMGMSTTPADNGHWIQFHADTTSFSILSLSFAVNTAGNGFNMVTFSYSTSTLPGPPDNSFTTVGSQAITSGHGFQIITFALPAGAAGQPDVTLRLTFDGGTSSGNNLQTVIDNIKLTPEPATTAGGILGVLGLCWFQRRRLIRFFLPRRNRAGPVRLRRA